MIDVKEAERLIGERMGQSDVETVALDDAAGRVLREPIRADRPMPPFDRVALDGVALDSRAVAEGQRRFRVVGSQAAGDPRARLPGKAECLEIATGGALPEGADCVVPVEDLRIAEGWATLREGAAAPPGQGVHAMGSDAAQDDPLVPAGASLGPKELAVAAAVGQLRLAVAAAPRIAAIASGDELVPVESEPEPHQIRRSNDRALAGALELAGYGAVERLHLSDNLEASRVALRMALARNDILVLAGGISKGRKDFLAQALEAEGVAKAFQWVRQRPGKPMWFGQGRVEGAERHVFALPGNPVSCFVCLRRYVIPALQRWQGKADPPALHARLEADFSFPPPLTLFLPVAVRGDPDGFLWAKPIPFNTSGDLASLVPSTGFLELPAAQDRFPQGAALPYTPWSAA